jgi:anti-sigma factor RsiW
VNVDLEDARCDEESARLLPWYVNGRLSGADMERVGRHLQHCAICRRDLAHERTIRGLLKTDEPVEYAPQAGLARTLSRIDELSRDAQPRALPPPRPAAAARRRRSVLHWLTAAVVLQAVALGWLGAALRERSLIPASGPYTTLASQPVQAAPGPHIRALFAPSMTLSELTALLAANHLSVLRGPSTSGVYTLALASPPLTAGGLDRAVLDLHRDPRVLFAEPALNDAPGAP